MQRELDLLTSLTSAATTMKLQAPVVEVSDSMVLAGDVGRYRGAVDAILGLVILFGGLQCAFLPCVCVHVYVCAYSCALVFLCAMHVYARVSICV
jgi:hypothetical protein